MSIIEESYTEEEIQRHITSCFHSWDICEELSAKDSLDEEEQDRFDRNQEHIQIMLAKEWFSNGCTAEQLASLQTYDS